MPPVGFSRRSQSQGRRHVLLLGYHHGRILSSFARRIGSQKSVRAVARACAANPLAVAIPCHRVVRHDGELSGYRWGVERKRTLLEKEVQP